MARFFTSKPVVMTALLIAVLGSGNTPLSSGDGRILTLNFGRATIDFSALAPAAAKRARQREKAEVRRKIELVGQHTYIDEILLKHDSSLARWPARDDRSVRVWISPAEDIEGFPVELHYEVQQAFFEWQQVGLPFRFAFVRDSVDADVHVGWVDQFEEPISGSTLWARDQHWWIAHGRITVALYNNGGYPLSSVAVRAITLHEIGHLLGLDHTADSTSIMAPKVRVKSLSHADRATMKLLYSLPPGALR